MKANLELESNEGECRVMEAKLILSDSDRRALGSGISSVQATIKASGRTFRVLLLPEYSVQLPNAVVSADMRRRLEGGQEVEIPIEDHLIKLNADSEDDPCLVAQMILKPCLIPYKELVEIETRQLRSLMTA